MVSRWRPLLFTFIFLTVVAGCRRDQPPADPTSSPAPTPTAASDSQTPLSTAVPASTPLPEPQLIGNLEGAPGLYPRLLGQNPSPGGEVDLTGFIELYFDQPMNIETTAAALTVETDEGEPIDGEISWPQPRILRFKPAATLPADSRIRVNLTTAATSEEGIALLEPLTLSIRSQGSLEIAAVSPARDATFVPTDSPITVIFNRPVVPLTIGSAAEEFPNPLRISPPVEGHGKWVNTSVYLYRPTEPLIGRETYEIEVDAAVINRINGDGPPLADDVSWQFSVVAPTLSYLNLPGLTSYVDQSYDHLPLDQSFELFFNQPMDKAATEAAIFVGADSDNVPLEYLWNDLATSVTFTPTQLLEPDRSYFVSVTDNARSEQGGLIDEGQRWRMNTVAAPAVVGTMPADGTTGDRFQGFFRIEFASPMDFSSLEGKVSFNPPLPNGGDGFYDQWSWRYTFFGLEPSTDYVVTIAPGMADPYGNVISERQTIRFRTAPYTPSVGLQMHGPTALYRVGGSQEMWVAVRNVAQVDSRLSKLTVAQFGDLLYDVNPRSFNDSDLSTVWSQTVPVEAAGENVQERLILELAEADGEPLEPGLYFLAVSAPTVPTPSARHADARAVILATANLTLKMTTSEVMMWVTDLESGRPLASVPVTLYDHAANPVVSGTTDRSGLFFASDLSLIEDFEDRYFAVASGPDVFGVAVSEWSEGVSPFDFGVNSDFYLQPDQVNTYAYTDRPLYRPGQEVHFKGILRSNDDLIYEIPPLETVWVEIFSFDGLVFEQELRVNEYGTFAGSIELDDEAILGGYGLQVSTRKNGDWLGGASFNVAEYRKPTFAVEVIPDANNLLVGSTVQAIIEGEFFAGGAVAQADVEWFLNASETVFTPDDRELQQYSYENRDLDVNPYFFDTFGRFGETIATGRGQTDRLGRLLVSIPVDGLATGSTQLLTLEGVVTDLAGNVVAGRTTLMAHPSSFYGGIRTNSRIAQAGEESEIEVVVIDWREVRQAGVPVTVEIVEREWFSVQEEDESGQVVWRTTVEENVVAEFSDVTTGSDGTATVSFVPPEGGIYRAYAVVTDPRGLESRTSTFFWAADEGFIPWRRTNDHTFDLISDRSTYAVGETAEILIASPFQGDATALVTVERGHITRREVIELDSNSTVYRLPISGEMAPNVFVSVLIMKGVDDDHPVPDFKYGLLQFDVEREEQTLNIDIVPDRAQLGPGDAVNFTIRVTDHAGRPVEAELSLALVDKALLALQPDHSPPLLDFFYSRRWLGVRTSLLLAQIMDTFNQELQDQFKGGGGGAGGDFGVFEARTEFKDTAFWEAQIQTGADGTATVTIDLPDNLTTWLMDARAVTLDTKVGQASAEIQTTLPLLIEPQTPRFLIVGDEVVVGATVRNTTAQAFDVAAELTAEGVEIITPAAQSLTVPAGSAIFVSWSIVAQEAERVDLLFSAEGGGYRDASRPTLATLPGGGIPVYRYEVPETAGTSGQLLDEGIIVESLALPIFEDSIPTSGDVTIELAPSLAAAMTDGLEFLEHYPYECTEQVVSKFLPNVMTSRAMAAAGVTDEPLAEDLEQQINVALQRIYSRQQSSGGWGWWSNSPANNLVTGYVVLGLYEAQQSGIAVRENVLESGINYLAVNFNRDEEQLNERARLNREAFVTYVLATTGQQPTAEINELFDDRLKLDLYARALLARAIHQVDPGDPRLQTLVSDLTGAAILSATGAHWEEPAGIADFRNWNTDVRSTGIIVGALAELDPDNPLTANGVRWLMAHRTAGRWSGTQETAWVVMGLTDWMVASGELEGDFIYEVGLNDELLGGGTVTPSTLRTPLTVQAPLSALQPDALNRLAIGRTAGPGNLYYTAHMKIFLPVEEVEPFSSGIIISRSYYRTDDPLTPVTDFEQGETVMVRLTIVAPNNLHYLLVDDWLPAGFEAIDSTLQTTSQVGLPDPFELNRAEFGANGWGWWYFDHVQLRDERVVLSASFLPEGTYEYVYLARAATPGSFRVLPPTAQEFYFPEVYGRGAGSLVTVTPRGQRQPSAAAPAEPVRVQFNLGATGAEVGGVAGPGRPARYLLQAQAGQTMTIDALAPGSDVSFSVTAPDGQLIATTRASTPSWTGLLPADGDYLIELRAVGSEVSFSLRIEIE